MRTSRRLRRERQRAYLARRRAKAKAYLGARCVYCGGTEKLQFDHVDPATKTIAVATAIAKHWSWSRLVIELDKCQLLCQPCHARKSTTDGTGTGGRNRIADPAHGTWARHVRDGCKCVECRAWRRSYRSGLVDARGNKRA